MLEDYKFLSESFEEKKTRPTIFALVDYKGEEKDLLKSKILMWYSQETLLIDSPEDLFNLLNQKSQKVIIIIREGNIDQEYFRAIRVGRYKQEVIPFSFSNSDLENLKSTLDALLHGVEHKLGFTDKSLIMKEVLNNIFNLAKEDCSVLISGPVGSGKKTSALALHRLSSNKDDLVQINLSVLETSAFEKTLEYSGKNIYLQNIENIPSTLKEKVIEILKDKNREIRLFIGTSLSTTTFGQRYPEIYKLMSNKILNIPPLCQRKEDIPIIVQQFIEKYSSIHNSKGTSIDEEALITLMEYNWTSNVLELENLMERLVILHGGAKITRSDLPEKILKNVEIKITYQLPTEGLILKDVIAEIENSLISQALTRSSGNKNKAARLLGLNRTTLVEKLKKRSSKS